jgi:hypothetical protein
LGLMPVLFRNRRENNAFFANKKFCEWRLFLRLFISDYLF